MGRSVRTRLLTAGILIAVFGTGVLVGLVVDSELRAVPTTTVAEVTENDERPESGEEPTEEGTSERRYIYEKVGPNETQLALIESVVAEHRARRDSLDEDFEARHEQEARSILLSLRAEIKSVLGPEQAAEYQKLLDEYDAQQAREEAQGDAAGERGDQRD